MQALKKERARGGPAAGLKNLKRRPRYTIILGQCSNEPVPRLTNRAPTQCCNHPGRDPGCTRQEDSGMRKLVVLLAIFAMTGAIFASPLWAEDHSAPDPADTGNFSHEYGGEFDLFDIILMRPVGLAACVMDWAGP